MVNAKPEKQNSANHASLKDSRTAMQKQVEVPYWVPKTNHCQMVKIT